MKPAFALTLVSMLALSAAACKKGGKGDKADADGDGVIAADDCDDNNADVYPDADELCDDLDNNCDGEVDDGFWFPWVWRETDLLIDGTVDSRMEWDWSDEGIILEVRQDYDGDGDWDNSWGYDVDAEGKILLYWGDSDGDGDHDYETAYEYDAQGHIVETSTDSDGDGDYDSITTTVWEGDQAVRYESDYDADGTPEHVEEYDYDEAAFNVGWRVDYDADGDWEESWERTVDAEGNTLTEKYTSDDGETVSETCTTHELDSDGNVTRSESDIDCDGSVEGVTEVDYDADGHATESRNDWDNDGTWDSINTYEIDAEGRETRVEYDSDGDGDADYVYAMEYDDHGNLVWYGEDQDGDGTWDYQQRTTYTYDAEDRLIRTEYDDGDDGSIEYIYEYADFSSAGVSRTSRWDETITEGWDAESTGEYSCLPIEE